MTPSARPDGRAGRLSFGTSPLKLGDGAGQLQAQLGGSLRFDGHAVRMSSSMAVRTLQMLAERGEIDGSVPREAAARYRLLDVTAGTSGNAGGES